MTWKIIIQAYSQTWLAGVKSDIIKLMSLSVLLLNSGDVSLAQVLTPQEDIYIPPVLYGQCREVQVNQNLDLSLEEIGVIGMRVGGWGDGEITHVYYDGPAYRAGIKTFDKLISVNGVPFKDLTSIKINGHKCHAELVGRVDRIPIQLTIEKFACRGPKIQTVWVQRCSVLDLPVSVQRHYRRLFSSDGHR